MESIGRKIGMVGTSLLFLKLSFLLSAILPAPFLLKHFVFKQIDGEYLNDSLFEIVLGGCGVFDMRYRGNGMAFLCLIVGA